MWIVESVALSAVDLVARAEVDLGDAAGVEIQNYAIAHTASFKAAPMR